MHVLYITSFEPFTPCPGRPNKVQSISTAGIIAFARPHSSHPRRPLAIQRVTDRERDARGKCVSEFHLRQAFGAFSAL